MDRKEQKRQRALVLERTAYALIGAITTFFAIILSVSMCSRSPEPYYPPPAADESSVSLDKPEELQKVPDSNSGDSVDKNETDADADKFEVDYDETYEEYEDDYAEYEVDYFADENEEDVEVEEEYFSEYDLLDDEYEEYEDDANPSKRIVVPDDFKTLAEALDFVGSKGTVLLRKNAKPYELGQSCFLDSQYGALIHGSIVIRGETDNPEDVTILVPAERRIFVNNTERDSAALSNLTIRSEGGKISGTGYYPSILALEGDVEIRNCIFQAERYNESLVGVSVLGKSASAKLADCVFSEYGGYGVFVGEQSTVTIIRCRFDKSNRYGLYIDIDGKVDASGCVFRRNRLAVYGALGASGSFIDCEFVRNRQNWSFEDDLNSLNVSRLRNRED